MKMNKKGFTLVEMLFVILLVAIIATIIFPNILDAVTESKNEKYENLEKILVDTMKMYNTDKGADLWSGTSTCVELTLDDLQRVNPNLKLDNCVLYKPDASPNPHVRIKKVSGGYDYIVGLRCGASDDGGVARYEYVTPGVSSRYSGSCS